MYRHSYFRCLSIHGTHNTTVTRNVAFDIYGHCYYIEDGVEVHLFIYAFSLILIYIPQENNTLSFNLATNVHTIYSHGDCGGEDECVYTTIPDVLHLPADVAASGTSYLAYFCTHSTFSSFPSLLDVFGFQANSVKGFYITNAHNYFIGNAAAGGFSGYPSSLIFIYISLFLYFVIFILFISAVVLS